MEHMRLRLRYLFFFLFAITILQVSGQTCPGFTFNTQSEVDGYASGEFPCTEISGDLIFDGIDITDISAFSSIKSIDGALIIRNTSVNHLNHVFYDLETIDGDLIIESNPDLSGILDFPKLASIAGQLDIRQNPSLVSIIGFENLISVGDYFEIEYNDVLVSIDGFDLLEYVDEDFEIRRNPLLPSISGFNNLRHVGYDFEIEYNDVLAHLSGFNNVKETGNELSIEENKKLASIPAFPELVKVGDDLCIEDTEALTEISGFGKLVSIGNDLDIRDNSALLYVTGFGRLEIVKDRWDFEDNDVLISIPVFPSLKEVGAFEFDNNDAFVNLEGFPALTLIAGKSAGSPEAVEIEDNASLKYISGLNALTKVDLGNGLQNVFSIQRNPALLEITGFQQLAEVVDDFIIVNNASLLHLNGFNQLKEVGSDLRIRFNDSLLEILGFKALRRVGGNLAIEDNPALKTLGSFSKLQHIEDRLRIVGNTSLDKLNGFNALSHVGENIRIGMNDALVAVKGFDGLTEIGNSLRISNNTALEFIYAFRNLGSVPGTLTILNNPSLFFCCGLTRLISEGGFGAINIAGNAPGCNSVMEILAVCAATLSDCTPNCKASINAGVNRDGLAILRPSDWVTDTAACSSGLEITIETTWGGPIFGPQIIGMNGAFAIHACPYLFQTLKIKTRSASGTCWTTLTFKQGNGPTIDPVPAQTVYCTDDLVAGPDPALARTAWIPCSEEVPAEFVTDWVTPIDCDPGVNDTVKIIYREWEAFDKDGRRGVQFDTLYVLQFPEITATSIYCERKDTTYCGDTTVAIGPYIVYPDLAGGCDTSYLVTVSDRDNDQMLEFNPAVFANKCGINVHVDAWKFPGECEIQYRVQVDVKQECYGPAQTLCMVPPAGIDPNFAEQLGPGYWRCEFWVIDIDTLGPEIVCKGDELFSGPFDIENWELVAGLVNPPVMTPAVEQTHTPDLDYFNLDNLPYSLIIESELATEFQDDFSMEINTDDLDLADSDEDEESATIEPATEESIFFIAPYKAQAAAIYRATEDTEFNFVWDFTLEPQDDMLIFGANTEALRNPFDACVTIAYYVNGVGYRMVEGEEGPCGFIKFQDLQANHTMGVSLLDPVTVFESQLGRANIPLEAGDELIILALWDSNAKATLRIMGQNLASTSKTECAAHAYIPPLNVVDDWSGAKQAKATVEGYGDVQLDYNAETGCFESHLKIKFPFRYEPYKITYEAFDSCHNVSYDSCYLIVKDDIKPVPVIDKGVTVSLSDKKAWLDAEVFNEGSFDNCGVNLLLVRRNDWYKSCINLCNDLEYICSNEHEDTLWRAVLEADKNIDPVEAHYRKTLEWLATDDRPCAEIIYNAWQYDLIKHAMQECFEHPYAIDDHAIREFILECSYHLDDFFKAVPLHPGNDIFSARFTPDLLDTYQQIGGGWSDAVAFSCEDACGPVTVEILVMDYWCNWATAWTEVWVEDKTPVKVVKDVIDIDQENAISCKTYRENRYSYPDQLHPVSLEYIVDVAKTGDKTAQDRLDNILGGYCKAWVDPYGNYIDADGEVIECDIPFADSQCFCKDTTVSMLVYDEHHGYIWKDSTYRFCYYDSVDHTFQKGIVLVNCEENVYCEQEVWCDIDHCGEGYIYRKFKIWQSCPESFYSDPEVPDSLKHEVDTIIRRQRIKVGNFCPIDKGMFNVPPDQELFACQLEYGEDGNVVGAAGPEHTGYATYKFDDDCRIIGIAHSDKVYKIVGGDGFCYKIIRTWYFADWCDGEPADDNWWQDETLVTEYCEQKIFVRDTTAPVCTIAGPVEDGEQIQVGACAFNLEATVEVSDECGVTEYYWEVKDIKDDGSPVLVDSDKGALSGQMEDVITINSANLPASLYKLIVKVTDACNNEGVCEYFFEVINVKKPAAICITTLTARLNPMDRDQDGVVDTATIIVWAEEFDRSSEVACNDEYLEYRLEILEGIEDDATYVGDTSYLEFGCVDIGPHMVRLWVISQPSGTVDFCDLLLNIQGDPVVCGGNEREGIGQIGSVTDMHNENNDQSKEKLGKKTVSVSGDAGQSSLSDLGGFHLDQNRPNPFHSETTIGFVLPESTKATLTIYDLTGKALRSVEGEYNRGYNEIKLNTTSLGRSNVMYYQLKAGHFSETRKMIMLR